MKAFLAILIAIMTTALLAGCATDNATDNKEVIMTTKNFDLKDFTRIEVGGAFEVDIARGDSFHVTVTADDFPHVRVETLNDTLIIRRQGIACSFGDGGRLARPRPGSGQVRGHYNIFAGSGFPLS